MPLGRVCGSSINAYVCRQVLGLLSCVFLFSSASGRVGSGVLLLRDMGGVKPVSRRG